MPVSVQVNAHDSSHDSAHDHASDNSSVQPSVQVINLINSIDSNELSIEEILEVYKLVYKSRWYFKKHTILPAIVDGYVEMVYPDKPNHPKQKYRLTAKGIALKEQLKNKH